MTIWTPTLEPGARRYEAIAEALAESIARGELRPGDRLPTHRELAEGLDVALGTVTRAYAEAQRRGLVVARVGRGTFVKDPTSHDTRWQLGETVDETVIDMGLLVAPRVGSELIGPGIVQAATATAERLDLLDLLGYQPHAGTQPHRSAGAAWIGRTGLDADPERVLVCGSAQHATAAVLSVLVKPGGAVFVEELTSPGMKDIAAWLDLRLHGLPTDREGILPDAFEAAARAGAARVLYCVPTLQNPTTATMSEGRRAAIADIALAHGVAIVEDGVHGLLPDAPEKPLAAAAPGHAFYVTSLSKTVSPGLRLGFLLCPENGVTPVESAVRATLWMASPLLAEIARRWIEDGTADRILGRIREEASARQTDAAEILEGYEIATHPRALHQWLRLPASWQPRDFAVAARARGVAVTPPAVFATRTGPLPRAVRISLGAPATREETRRGLGILAELLARRS